MSKLSSWWHETFRDNEYVDKYGLYVVWGLLGLIGVLGIVALINR